MDNLLGGGGGVSWSPCDAAVSQASSSCKASNFMKSDLFYRFSFLILWGKIFQFEQLSLL